MFKHVIAFLNKYGVEIMKFFVHWIHSVLDGLITPYFSSLAPSDLLQRDSEASFDVQDTGFDYLQKCKEVNAMLINYKLKGSGFYIKNNEVIFTSIFSLIS